MLLSAIFAVSILFQAQRGRNFKPVWKPYLLSCGPNSLSFPSNQPLTLLPFSMQTPSVCPQSLLGILRFRHPQIVNRCARVRTIRISWFFWATLPGITSPLTIKKSRQASARWRSLYNLVSQVKGNLVDMKSDSVKFSPRGIWHYYIPYQSRHCASNNCIRCRIRVLLCCPTSLAVSYLQTMESYITDKNRPTPI